MCAYGRGVLVCERRKLCIAILCFEINVIFENIFHGPLSFNGCAFSIAQMKDICVQMHSNSMAIWKLAVRTAVYTAYLGYYL